MAPHHIENPDVLLEEEFIWIFGYGSLVWKPDFKHTVKKVGYLNGFGRRFWQGSVTHRGYPDAPGRVATLVENKVELTWGVAFKVEGQKNIKQALEKLNCRECVLGGYIAQMIEFYPKDGTTPFSTLVFRATPTNTLYLGEATELEIAQQVVACRGFSGPNSEYVIRLAEFMETELPDVYDSHLYNITAHIRKHLKGKETKLRITNELACSSICPGLNYHSKWTITTEFGNVLSKES